MSHTTALLLISVFMAAPAFAEIYKWTDDQGVVHFSDEPHAGAETLEPGSPPVIETRIPEMPALDRDEAGDDEAATRYRRLEVIYPENDQPVRSNAGELIVRVALEPLLRGSVRLVPLLDGSPVEALQTSPGEFRLDNVPRGTHTVGAQVESGEGRVRLRAEPVVVHLRRTSVNAPAR